MFLEDPNSKEVKEIMEKNEDVKKAIITVKEMSEDEKMERLAELREKAIRDEKALYNTGIREGKELGEKIGREKGIKENKRAIAKKMLSKGIRVKEIIELTGLTEEEIEELKNK